MKYMYVLIALFAIVGLSSAATLANTVTVEAVDGQGRIVSADAAAEIKINESYSAEFFKDADVLVAKPGELVTYRYTFTNTGTGVLTGLSVVDDKFGSVAMSKTSVAPGETVNGTKTYTVKETDLPGPLMNSAIAKAAEFEINATAYVDLIGEPAIAVEKLTDVTTADIGQTVEYKFNVTNTGSVTLTINSVMDDKLGKITLPQTKLAPGETVVAVKKHTVTVADLN